MSRLKTSAVLAAAFVGMFAGSALAEETVVAKVPFAFVVRNQEFPAGRYMISTEAGVLAVHGMDTGGGGFALTVPASGSDPVGDQPALVFIRNENHYLLSQVWQSGSEGLTLSERSLGPGRASAERDWTAAPTVVLAAYSK
jgi:hypothetical protein